MAGRLSRPRQLGCELLVEVGVRSEDQIDPLETAKELGIEVTFGHLTGATARIFRIGPTARIRVSTDIVTEGRRRMSIMHEIAHYVLGHALPREGELESWFRTSCATRSRREEREADVLAIEHLTPTHMVLPYCTGTAIDLETVRALARVFRVSPVMAAMRLVELSPEACAVVYAEAGCVRWMKPSRTFPGFLAKGAALAPSSIATDYFARGVLCDMPRTQAAAPWLGSRTRRRADALVEYAMLVPEPGWGGVLSLLWVPQAHSRAISRPA